MPYFVDFDPVFFAIGPLKIHWYAITYLIGFGLFILLGNYKVATENTSWDKDQVSDFLFYGALGVILGGRIGWVLFYNDTPLSQDPWLPLKVQDGGMSFHGGLLGVFVAMFYFKYKTKKTFFEISDFVAPLVPLGIASVRIGNFINGELWGRITDKPWGMIFPDSLPPSYYTSGIENLKQLNATGALSEFTRHPSTLYESLLEGFVTFFIVWFVSRKYNRVGLASGMFLICYSVSRFLVEFVREPDENRGFIFFDWMTMGQVLTVPMFILGMLFVLGVFNKK